MIDVKKREPMLGERTNVVASPDPGIAGALYSNCLVHRSPLSGCLVPDRELRVPGIGGTSYDRFAYAYVLRQRREADLDLCVW